jgi:Mce-associated membrane protein
MQAITTPPDTDRNYASPTRRLTIDREAGDPVGATDGIRNDPQEGHPPAAADVWHRGRSAVALGVAVLMVTGGLGGWLGYRALQAHREAALRGMYLQLARQAALDLTTIDYTHADSDVQRILDAATGKFRDDFQSRSQLFVDVVKRAQSKSEGTINTAGLESFRHDSAEVLVAVTVKTTYVGNQSDTKAWRMRIDVQKVGDSAKMSNVGFVP